MMSPAIAIEKLSKSYSIRHQAGNPKKSFLEKFSNLKWPLMPSVKRSKDTRETFWALKDISFEVEQGEILGIIGRNGAGKSTLLKILSRITDPTSGSATIHGRVGSLLEVGTGFHPELTGRENIYLNGTLLGMKRSQIDGLFDSIVAFAETEKFLDTPVKRYSSGMYVRLAFAVAAHLEPDVLILDEVLAVGDINFQKKCINRMSKVAKEGRTVVIVTHSMVVAETLTHRCAWLDGGRLKTIGSSRDVVEIYNKDSQSKMLGTTEGLHDYKLRRGSGEIRLNDIKIRNADGDVASSFHRNEAIHFSIDFSVVKACDNPTFLIGFKMGIGGDIILRTARFPIADSALDGGTHVAGHLTVPTNSIPAGVYDLYFWVGPAEDTHVNEFYDIVDSMLPPVHIVEKTPSGNRTFSEIPAFWNRTS